jgi:hypothetical protein
VTNIAVQKQYWQSPDEETFLANVDTDTVYAKAMARAQQIIDARQEIYYESEEGQHDMAEMLESVRQVRSELERKAACLVCGTVNQPGAKFCVECGTRLVGSSR